ncbi:MAG: DUF2059 domain-containing protein [Tabrizicola sp.]|jgi:hypothetical protein|nr:DUF2059 domain-containing protein [Tabrizicola sp.]
MPRLHIALVALLALTGPVAAQTTETAPPVATGAEVSAEMAAVIQALRLADLFAVLRDEGLAYGTTLETDMFPGGGGAAWPEAVSQIYDVPTLRARFDAVLQAELGSDTEILRDLLDFYESDLGKRVVGLEIDARRAFIDDAAEDAARVAADRRRAENDPRHDQLERFIAAGDLLEMNVAGALSGNLAFLTGMNETGLYDEALPQADIMADVWGQEEQIRSDTTSWLHAFLGLAYQPLTEAELDAYIAFMESPAGQRLNAALFLAYDQVFRQVSQDLGRAAGLAMQGRDI